MSNKNRTKRENERKYICEQKRKGKKIIVVMAFRRRAMKELGRVTFSPDTMREREREREKERERERERERLKM